MGNSIRDLKDVIKGAISSVPGGKRALTAYRDQVDRKRIANEFRAFRQLPQVDPDRFGLRWDDRWLCLHDNTASTGFDRHYVFHPAWAARVLAETRPQRHVDVGSHLQFIAIASAFVKMEFLDYRPVDLDLSDLRTDFGDLLDLPLHDESVDSLSCMHVIEHVGLGRYGDPLDPDGDLKSIGELKRVLAPNGSLLFVVPMAARPKIQFNAHRIYSYEQVRDYFSDLTLQQFALIPDLPEDGNLVVDPGRDLLEKQRYACGCFWFRKGSTRP